MLHSFTFPPLFGGKYDLPPGASLPPITLNPDGGRQVISLRFFDLEYGKLLTQEDLVNSDLDSIADIC